MPGRRWSHAELFLAHLALHQEERRFSRVPVRSPSCLSRATVSPAVYDVKVEASLATVEYGIRLFRGAGPSHINPGKKQTSTFYALHGDHVDTWSQIGGTWRLVDSRTVSVRLTRNDKPIGWKALQGGLFADPEPPRKTASPRSQ